MKIRVYKDSAYPLYGISSAPHGGYEPELEITEEENSFILDAEDRYDRAQKILARAYEAKPIFSVVSAEAKP